MEAHKSLARTAYLVAALLIVIPIYGATAAMLPLQMSEARWRWGTVGQFSNVLLVPLIGLFLLMAIAALRDNRAVRRAVGSICGVAAVLLFAMCVLFVLDYFQVRTLAVPKAQHIVATASVTACIKNGLYIVVLALLGLSGFADSRRLSV
jgi:hypothetical protein